jgi:hypothetical protein
MIRKLTAAWITLATIGLVYLTAVVVNITLL